MEPVLVAVAIYSGLLGLVIGSFLNVVVYRVPRDLSIVRPGSACPRCGTPIAPRDNVPVLSWILLRGHCRSCHEPISIRYPLVELGVGLLFAASTVRFGLHVWLVAVWILEAGLVALAQIDAEHLTLPRSIVWPMLGAQFAVLAGAAAQEHDGRRLLVAAIAAAAWFVPYFVINLVSPQALGFGDVRLVLSLGLGLGWFGPGVVFVGFFAANVLAIVVGVANLARHATTRRQPLPYGTYLALGTIVALFVGGPIVNALALPGLR